MLLEFQNIRTLGASPARKAQKKLQVLGLASLPTPCRGPRSGALERGVDRVQRPWLGERSGRRGGWAVGVLQIAFASSLSQDIFRNRTIFSDFHHQTFWFGRIVVTSDLSI